MELQKIAVILLAYLVTGKNNDIFRIIALDKGYILVNRVCSSLIPVRTAGFLVGRQYMHASVKTVEIPRLSVADILVQYKGLILGQDAYRINA